MKKQFNIRNNIITPGSTLVYTDGTFLAIVSAEIEQPELSASFNIVGNYFHQTITLGFSGNVSISGASISVSPKKAYKMHQIVADTQVRYTP